MFIYVHVYISADAVALSLYFSLSLFDTRWVAAEACVWLQLKRVCMDFILKEFGRVIRTESFMTLATQQPLLAREARIYV